MKRSRRVLPLRHPTCPLRQRTLADAGGWGPRLRVTRRPPQRCSPTEFEEAVYRVVRRIPRGQTRSYAWVAAQLGNPMLARAVGNALRRNPYAPQVPCHRVVRADGALGGFARGPAAKRVLLRAEGWKSRNSA